MTRTPPSPVTVTDDVRERVRAERLAQGLPEHIEDPVVLARVADLVRQAQRRQGTS